MEIYKKNNSIIFSATGGFNMGKVVEPTSIEFPFSSFPGAIKANASWFALNFDGKNYELDGHILYSQFKEDGDIVPVFTHHIIARYSTDILYDDVEVWKDTIPGSEELVGEYEFIGPSEEPPEEAAWFDVDGNIYHKTSSNAILLDDPPESGGTEKKGE